MACDDAQTGRAGSARPALVYVLHSGELFGTERMALATLAALREPFDAMLIAPVGPVHGAAAALGIASIATRGRGAMLAAIGRQLWQCPDAAVITTGVWQAAAAVACQRALGGRGAQLHVVHGGTDERLSYGRKRWLARLPVRIVAISEFVRSRLLAHDVPECPVVEGSGGRPHHSEGSLGLSTVRVFRMRRLLSLNPSPPRCGREGEQPPGVASI